MRSAATPTVAALHSELLRRLADGLEHELRNGLNGLGLGLQRLERELGRGGAAATLAGAIPTLRRRIDDLARLQQRLVDDWCRCDGRPGTIDAATLLEELRPLARAALAPAGCRLEIDAGPSLPPAAAPRWRLAWLLLGGLLAAAEEAAPDALLRLGAEAKGPGLRFCLSVVGLRSGAGSGLWAALAALEPGPWQKRGEGSWQLSLPPSLP